MKKILYILATVLLIFSSCRNFNEDNFSEYGDWETPTNLVLKSITMTDADYATIVSALRANKTHEDSLKATKLSSAKKFSADLSAAELIPYLLTANYYAADMKSSIKVTYNFDRSRDSIVGGLSGTSYVLTNADYQSVWGDTYIATLTPSKSPATYLPVILKTNFPTAKNGSYKIVEYSYSETELIANKTTKYAAYTYSTTTSKWQAVPTTTYVLQPEDYVTMGLTSGTLATASAPNYLPTFCNAKYLYAQNGDQRILVYRTAANTFYADRLTKSNGVWTIDSYVDAITDQFVMATVDGHKKWIYDPTIIIPISKTDYQLVVDHVKANEALNNPGAMDSRGNAEFYYGFSAYYGNITYRNVDRIKDNTFPSAGTLQEQIDFMNQRTIDGLIILLNTKYPDATATVNGLDQYSRVTGIQIYADPTSGAPTRRYWNYTFQCTGSKTWKFVKRESTDGVVEVAK